MENPILSIIVPVFNVEKYLHQCVDSILTQTFSNFELILVNDGSTDGSGKICDYYVNHDNRVQVIHKSNGGHTSSRNAGMSIAKCDYIGFVDSDDWIDPNMYQYLMNAIQTYQADIAICDACFVTVSGKMTTLNNFQPGFYDKNKLMSHFYPTMLYEGYLNKIGIQPALWNKIFKRKIIEENLKMVDEQILTGADMACVYPSFLDAKSIIVIDEQPLYYYRQNVMSVTQSYKVDYLNRSLLLYNNLQKVSKKKNVYDLDNQIMGRLQWRAVMAVENEFKITSPKNYFEKWQFLNEVCHHPDIVRAYRSLTLDTSKTLLKYKIYARLIKWQLALPLFGLLLVAQTINRIRENLSIRK